MRLTRSYEARGLLELLTSYDNATPGSGSVVNQVKYEYDGFMLLTKESQSHQGAVTSSTPKAQYGYTGGSSNHARRISSTSPDGTVLEYDYGSAGSAGDALNRVEHLKCGTGMAVEYGTGTLGSGCASYALVRCPAMPDCGQIEPNLAGPLHVSCASRTA